MARNNKLLGLILAILMFPALAQAEAEGLKVIETPTTIEIQQPQNDTAAETTPVSKSQFDPLKYKLGPDDVVEIIVMRHPEFSGTYPINLEGKIQYKFVGDIEVTGLTKLEVEQKVKEVISNYVISPEVNVTVTEYKSKVFYILGEVGTPGKYYMRSESILIREAVFQAGLLAHTAAMRKCQLITPDIKGRPKVKIVNLYSILYGGDLRKNIEMHPGDVLYIPSTVMAKIVRMINPLASTVGIASSVPSETSTGRAAVQTLAK